MSGRIRTIKPELLEDAKTANLSHLEFRLFVSMILMADDYGNLRATPSLIVGNAFWGTKDNPADIESATAELEEVGLVRTYEIRGQLYAHVCGWAKHQRVDKPGKPRVPAENEPEAHPARPWVTYVVRLGESGPIKIGKAIDVDARIAKLQTGCPEKLHVIKVIGKNIEAELHRRFADYRKHGEWFDPAPELVDFFAKESFANHSRAPREPFAPDLRPPTPTNDHRASTSDAREDGGSPEEPEEVTNVRYISDRPPPPESVEPPEPAAAPAERPIGLVDRVWREMWQAKYRRPYESAGRPFGADSEDQVQVRLAEKASVRGDRAEAYLRHKFAAYLRDKGDRNYLDERCHPLRLIERDWAAYGEPKEPKRMVPRREEPEAEPVSIEEMQARAKAAMKLVGNGGSGT